MGRQAASFDRRGREVAGQVTAAYWLSGGGGGVGRPAVNHANKATELFSRSDWLQLLLLLQPPLLATATGVVSTCVRERSHLCAIRDEESKSNTRSTTRKPYTRVGNCIQAYANTVASRLKVFICRCF